MPRYEPDVGLTRLETVRVSRAAADQRRGRAGRTESGICYRLWDEPQTASLEPYARPEILAADLSGLLLDLAQWGTSDLGTLAFLDPPPAGALAEARALLTELGAIDKEGRITGEGRRLRALPLPPRLARMVVDAGAAGSGALAADIAAILSERGLGGDSVDLTHRLDQFRRDRSRRGEDARSMAKRWADTVIPGRERHKARSRASSTRYGANPGSITTTGSMDSGFAASRRPEMTDGEVSPGGILSLAYPDRIAKSRGAGGAFLLANGRGANVDPASPLSREPFLTIAELAGTAAQGRVLLAASITLDEIEQRFADRIESREDVSFDASSASLRGRRSHRLGALALSEQTMRVAPGEANARLLAEGIARLGVDRLPWTKSLKQWRDRVMFLRRAEGDEWPDLSNSALAANVEWLLPVLGDKTALSDISGDEISAAVQAFVPWNMKRRIEAEAPTHFAAPSGSSVPIDYEAEEGPKLSIRVQELFGLDRHPSIAGGKVPLVVELLSPAHRPVQVTRDLPGFWRGSYAAVKTELKGRYPRHPWPDNPLVASATRRAKPRGT